MILAINYADEKFKKTQHFNSKRALEFGADRVIEYNRGSLPEEFISKNAEIINNHRGGGYWLWKPYVIIDAITKINYDDYLVYTDSGSAFVQPVRGLINAMDGANTDIMCFSLGFNHTDRKWSKRDAIVLMGCDKEEILDSPQICATYIIIKKSYKAVSLVEDYLRYCQDPRIITDRPNELGYENYPEFVENRHDQTVWSLLCKKHGIAPFRDPSEWGNDRTQFPEDVNQRSPYCQVIESHRNRNIRYSFQLHYNEKKWYVVPRKMFAIFDAFGRTK